MMGRFRTAIGELGWFHGCLYVVNRGFKALGGVVTLYPYVFVAQPVPEKPLLPGHRGRSVVVRKVAAGDPALAALPLDTAVLAHRFGQDAVCFCAFVDEQTVGCLWLCLGRYDEDEVRARFLTRPEGRTSWDFDVYIHPDHRRGFAFARLWDEANAFLREKGVEWTLSRISGFNAESINSHGGLGATRVGESVFFRIGRLQILAGTVTPFLHLSLGGRPTLRIAAPGG